MIIDVRSVPDGHSAIERFAALEGFRGDLPPFASPLSCRADIDRFGDTIALRVRFDGTFEMECARCLGSARVPVGGDVRVIIRESPGRRGAAGDGDEGVDFYFDANQDPVDISSALYDEVMTALPLKPLCSEDCRGVEIGGGASSGKGGEDAVDPRWEALRKLKR
jgi:uncharacterized protein